jgi:biofilm protein TabA
MGSVMILDKITNIHLYPDINPAVLEALRYLKETDFSKQTPGRKEINGDDIFSIISNYNTKDLGDCRLEAHRKYIDIHYLAEGSEIIGYSVLKDQEKATDYDAENDFILYCGEKNYLKLEQGMFAVFFPSDLHMPGLMIVKPAPVKKVVVKVRFQNVAYTLI